MAYDVLNQAFRKQIIQEIESDENKRRKAQHQKIADVYKSKQRKYVLDMLTKEFSPETVRDMRTCTSINLTKRVVNEQASIYKNEPVRTFGEASENELMQLEALYKLSAANNKLKKANQKYKLHQQAAMQVVPSMGGLKIRVLAPHQYDVVPSMEDPEVGEIYVVSGYNKTDLVAELDNLHDIQGQNLASKDGAYSDSINQKIADQDDWRNKKVYAWWTAQYNFLTNESGAIISPVEAIENPIQMLPFIDIAYDKDGEFWTDSASEAVEFNLDFSVVLSDTCNTNRLQAYSQPVITAEKLPEHVTVGPQHILFLPIDPTRPEIKPSFEFANPTPDMAASLDLQDRLLSYFLTSQGIDPKTISGKGDGEKYNSALERLLAMIEKFEASQDDIALFQRVELELYRLMLAWSNRLQGTGQLVQELSHATVGDSVTMSCTFQKPQFVKTASEAEDSVIKRMEAGLLSRKEAVMELRGVSEEQAEEIIQEIDQSESVKQPENDAVDNNEEEVTE